MLTPREQNSNFKKYASGCYAGIIIDFVGVTVKTVVFVYAPLIILEPMVESMQKFMQNMLFAPRGLENHFKKYPSECDGAVINDLLGS